MRITGSPVDRFCRFLSAGAPSPSPFLGASGLGLLGERVLWLAGGLHGGWDGWLMFCWASRLAELGCWLIGKGTVADVKWVACVRTDSCLGLVLCLY